MLAAANYVERRSFGFLDFTQAMTKPFDAGAALRCKTGVDFGLLSGARKRLGNGLQGRGDDSPVVTKHRDIGASLDCLYDAFADSLMPGNRAHTEIIRQNDPVKS